MQVRSINAAGAGPPTTPSLFAKTLGRPDAVRNITVAATGPGSVTIEWAPPVDDGGSPLTEYQVKFTVGGKVQTVSRPIQGTGVQRFTIGSDEAHGVRVGAAVYSVQVVSHNAHGASRDYAEVAAIAQ
mmetsp:Transcript_63446/g.150356  ORF Transcript_63446/g.150356 Transcript_63446/m.150356 type:complete len:128 (+) Transcript_63446:406-789(+)